MNNGHFEVLEFYNKMKNSTNGLPEWNQLHPHHQHQVVQACNLLLAVLYDNNVTGKNDNA